MSIEPPMIHLGYRSDWPEQIRALADDFGVHLPPDTGAVLSTRERARKLQAEHGVIDGPVYLNCRNVDSATPTFFDQILMFWPKAQLIAANDDVKDSFELAQSVRLAKGLAKDFPPGPTEHDQPPHREEGSR